MSVTIESYVLSLIDIMGQKVKLEKLDTLSMPLNKVKINDIFNDTYIRVQDFRSHMDKALAWLNQIKKNNQKSTFNSNDIVISSFSDLITSYVSLRDDKNKSQFEGVYFLLFGNGLVFLQMLSEQTPLRGGIDVGFGIKHSNHEIYGSALSKAYKLESNDADHFRIIVGDRLYQYINDTSEGEIQSNESLDYNIYWAKKCLEIIKKDIDGTFIIDFLSKNFQEMENFNSHYNKAKNFLKKEYSQCKDNSEVEKKYKMTLDYFLNSDYETSASKVDSK